MSLKDKFAAAGEALDKELATSAKPEKTGGSRTAPGMLMGAVMEKAGDLARIQELQGRLDAFGKATPVSEIALEMIDSNPYQPRIRFEQEGIDELAAQIKAQGLIQPITVRAAPEKGRFILVAGERRLRAVRALGWPTIEARVKAYSDDQAAVVSLLENEGREDLGDYERYHSYRELIRRGVVKSQAELAALLEKSRPQVVAVFAFERLPAGVLKILEGRPELLGYASAQKLAAIAKEGHTKLVVEGVEALAKGVLASEAALHDWLRKRLRPASQAAVRVIESPDGKPFFRVSAEGRKLTVTLVEKSVPDAVMAEVDAEVAKLLAKRAAAKQK